MLSETTVSNKILPTSNELKEMRKPNENPKDISWTDHERHFFVITDSARPVYVRYGDEVTVTPLLCTIVTFCGQLIRDGNQKLQYFVAGNKLFVFYVPTPFIYVCVSSVKLPISLIQKELQYLETTIYSLLTPMIAEQLRRRPNFDIKRQTSSSEALFTSLLENMDQSHSFVFHDCIPMSGVTSKRNDFKRIVYENRNPAIYGIVIFNRGELVLKIANKNFSLTTEDVFILSNNTNVMVDVLDALWPMWLPSHSEMLHILTVDMKTFGFKMIIITDQIESSAICTRISDQCQKTMLQEGLNTQIDGIPLFHPKEVLHWIVVNRKLGQSYNPYIPDSPLARAIYRAYAWTQNMLEETNVNGIFYSANEKLTIAGKNVPGELIIVAMPVGVVAKEAEKIIGQLEAYIKQNRSVLFDLDPLVWDEK